MASKVARSQPSTSSVPSSSAVASKSSEKTFMYDISILLKIDIPDSDYNADKAMAAASATLVSDIFTSHAEYNFLATPILRALDSALLTTQNKWEPLNNHLVIKKDIRIRGNLVNITEKPSESQPTFNKLTYNGCVHSSKVLLDYKIEFHFLPGILSAQRIYDSHEWKRDDTSQADDARSIKLREIISRHKGKTSLNHEYTWKEAFDFEGKVEEKKMKSGTKRKHQGD